MGVNSGAGWEELTVTVVRTLQVTKWNSSRAPRNYGWEYHHHTAAVTLGVVDAQATNCLLNIPGV